MGDDCEVVTLSLPLDPLPQTLVCHPSSRRGAVAGISAHLERTPDSLALRFRLEGRLDRLVIPLKRPPERRDGLWRHTCFEAFVGLPGEAGYAELNISPSGAWAAYRFASYREGMRDLELPQAPTVEVRHSDGELEVAVRVETVPAGWDRAEVVRVALCAVVEHADGALSYWALAHPEGTPDFHHPAGFVLEVTPH
jgi:hypothetical protein